MTIADVSHRMKVSRWTVQRWIQADELTVIRVGRNLRITPDSYRDFLNRHTVTPTVQRTAQ